MKSIDTVAFTWFSGKVLHVCEGGFRRRIRYLLTLVSPTSMPSLRSSPWMRGAPQSGFSRLIFRISSRISLDTGGRPGWPRRTFQVQNSRDPLQSRTPFGPGSTKPTHKNRSNRFSFGFFTERCSTPSWWRRAMDHFFFWFELYYLRVPRSLAVEGVPEVGDQFPRNLLHCPLSSCRMIVRGLE